MLDIEPARQEIVTPSQVAEKSEQEALNDKIFEIGRALFDNHEFYSAISVISRCLPGAHKDKLALIKLPMFDSDGTPINRAIEDDESTFRHPPEERTFWRWDIRTSSMRQYLIVKTDGSIARDITDGGNPNPDTEDLYFIVTSAKSHYPGDEAKPTSYLHTMVEAMSLRTDRLGDLTIIRKTGITPTFVDRFQDVSTSSLIILQDSANRGRLWSIETISTVTKNISSAQQETSPKIPYDNIGLEDALEAIVDNNTRILDRTEQTDSHVRELLSGFHPCESCLNLGLYLPQSKQEFLEFVAMLEATEIDLETEPNPNLVD